MWGQPPRPSKSSEKLDSVLAALHGAEWFKCTVTTAAPQTKRRRTQRRCKQRLYDSSVLEPVARVLFRKRLPVVRGSAIQERSSNVPIASNAILPSCLAPWPANKTFSVAARRNARPA